MNPAFQHFDKFIYRIPALSMSLLEQEIKQHPRVHELLTSYLSKPAVREAIYLASPDLYQEVLLFLSGEISKEEKPVRYDKFVDAALKYIYRMTYRATPFGTFAGVGVGDVGSENRISPDTEAPMQKVVRFDSGILIAIAEYILKQPELLKGLTFYANNSIYPLEDKYRYVEFFMDGEGKRVYHLSSFGKDEYTEAILAAAADGLPFSDIVALLVSDDISEEEATDFICELIGARILISDLEPLVVGEEYSVQFMRVLSAAISSSAALSAAGRELYRKIFDCIQRCLHLFDEIAADHHFPVEKYECIVTELETLGVQFFSKSSFQVDAGVRAVTQPIISTALAADIVEGFQYLLKFCRTHESSMMAKFTRDFQGRYEDRMVKLAEVMDPEIGIGYGTLGAGTLDFSPLVDDVPVPPRPAKKDTLEIKWDMDKHTFFFNKVLQAFKNDDYTVSLSDAEVRKYMPPAKEIPATVNAYVNVLYRKDEKPLIHFLNLGSGSAASMFGRFSVTDKDITALSTRVAEYEEEFYKGYVVAEINHLSDTRIGNITMRDTFRKHEIPYVTKSNAPHQEGIISVDDLYLVMVHGRLQVYAASLKKCVLPKLSNAHNFFMNTLPVYKFLADYQNEIELGGIDIMLDMGRVPEFFEFTPRVQYRNYIFSAARWSFPNTELMEIVAKNDTATAIGEIRKYLQEKRIPRRFYLQENHDNELCFDLENDISLELFIHVITKVKKLYFRECLFDQSNEGLVQQGDLVYAHELLLPLKNLEGKAHFVDGSMLLPAIPEYADEASPVERSFLPGNEWLFLKVYAGIDICEKIIGQVLPDFLQQLRASGKLGGWFFIRYSDPDHHIRLRLKVPADMIDTILSGLQQAIVSQLGRKCLGSIIVDTYQRELERYGFELMETAESIFMYDSELAVQLINETAAIPGTHPRWLVSLRTIDAYMNAFEMDIDEKYAFVKQRRDDFAREFNANKFQKRKIISKFRTAKEEIDMVMESSGHQYQAAMALIGDFEDRLKVIWNQRYRHQSRDKQLDFLNSFVHMHVVRLFRSKNRLTEYVLYFYLEQHFRYKIGEMKHLMHAE